MWQFWWHRRSRWLWWDVKSSYAVCVIWCKDDQTVARMCYRSVKFEVKNIIVQMDVDAFKMCLVCVVEYSYTVCFERCKED